MNGPGLADRLVGGPVGFRRRLERLGPTFVKIGQFLALRPDLLPQAYCDELMRLLDRAAPFPWAEAERLLRAELGGALDIEFASIDRVPAAAGSLAQVHLARLPDGTEVAVKILRPGIAEQVARDLRRARRFARLLEVSRVRLVVAPQEVVEELAVWLSQEIDLAHELTNLNRLRELTRLSPIERVPRPYPALSTPRVLTAGYLAGVRFSDLLAAGRTPGLLADLRELDIDTAALATNLLEATLGQIFEYKFFHADLHPGNLIALPGSVIGYVDFGLCDKLAETVRQRQLRYLTAIYERDVDAMFRALTHVLIPGDETDMEAFRADFFAGAMAYLARADDGAGPGERSPIAEWMVRVVQSARRHRLRIPPNILTMYRALLTAETVARRLDEHANLRRVAREFFEQLRLAEVLESLHPEQLKPMMFDLLTLCREAPRQLQQVLADAAEGRLAAAVETSESALTRRHRNQRAKLIATAVLSVGLSVSLSRPGSLVIFGVSLAGPLATLLILVYASLWWQWRRLR